MIRRCIAIVCVLLWPCCCVIVADDNDAIRDRIIKDWQARKTQVRAVRYVLEGRGFAPKGRGREPSESKLWRDHEYDLKLSLLVDLERNRFRKEKEEDVLDSRAPGGYARQRQLRTLNSREPQELLEAHPFVEEKLTIVSNQFFEPMGGFLEASDLVALLPHGIVPPLDNFVNPRKLNTNLSASDYYVHARARLRDADCIVLRTRPPSIDSSFFHEYWVDPVKGNAIVRWSAFINRRPLTQVDLTYRRIEHGWELQECEAAILVGDPTPRLNLLERLKVVEYQLNPPFADGDFEVPRKPGLIVEDRLRGGKFVVGADGKTFVPWHLYAHKQAANPLHRIIASVLACVVALTAGYVGYSLLKKRRAAPT